MKEQRIEFEMAALTKLISYPSEDVGQLAVAMRATLKAMINSIFPVVRLLATPCKKDYLRVSLRTRENFES